MSESVVAKRYADALFQLALEKDKADEFVSQLSVILDVFQENEKSIQFLSHPRVDEAEKMKFIDEVFQSADRAIINTLKVLIQRQRITNVTSILEHFIALYNEENKIAVATVHSVRELSDTEKADFEASFKKLINKNKIQIENIVDPSLIGGMRIRVGNTIYDGSISNKLERIRSNIVSAN